MQLQEWLVLQQQLKQLHMRLTAAALDPQQLEQIGVALEVRGRAVSRDHHLLAEVADDVHFLVPTTDRYCVNKYVLLLFL